MQAASCHFHFIKTFVLELSTLPPSELFEMNQVKSFDPTRSLSCIDTLPS